MSALLEMLGCTYPIIQGPIGNMNALGWWLQSVMRGLWDARLGSSTIRKKRED